MAVIYIDFEASSLMRGSFPVEMGLAVDGGDVSSWLIRPVPEWEEWSPASEALHGLCRKQLAEEGFDVVHVAVAVLEACSAPDCVLASDNPAHDAMWLNRLLDAAGQPRSLHVQDAEATYIAEARRLQTLAPPPDALWHRQVTDSLEVEARELVRDVHAAELARQRLRHRAGPDSEGMLWILQEIRGRVAARLAAAKP